jgi:amino acid transporter
MQQHLFTILAVLVILFAILVALFNPMLSLYIIGGVVVFAIGLLIYRLARRG